MKENRDPGLVGPPAPRQYLWPQLAPRAYQECSDTFFESDHELFRNAVWAKAGARGFLGLDVVGRRLVAGD